MKLDIEWFIYGDRLISKKIPRDMKADLEKFKLIFGQHESDLRSIIDKKSQSENFTDKALFDLIPEAREIVDRLNESSKKINKRVLKTWTDYLRKKKELSTTVKLSISNKVLEHFSALSVFDSHDDDWFKSKKKVDECLDALVLFVTDQQNKIDELKEELEQSKEELCLQEVRDGLVRDDNYIVKAFSDLNEESANILVDLAIELKLGKYILKVNDRNKPGSIVNTLKNIQVAAAITETLSQKTKDGNKDIFDFDEFEN
jgi:hypothetical protein